MPVRLNELTAELNSLLKPEQFNDYCPNGLQVEGRKEVCLLYTSPSPRDATLSRMPSSA